MKHYNKQITVCISLFHFLFKRNVTTNTVKRPKSDLGYDIALYKSAYFDWLIWNVSFQFLFHFLPDSFIADNGPLTEPELSSASDERVGSLGSRDRVVGLRNDTLSCVETTFGIGCETPQTKVLGVPAASSDRFQSPVSSRAMNDPFPFGTYTRASPGDLHVSTNQRMNARPQERTGLYGVGGVRRLAAPPTGNYVDQVRNWMS